MSTSGLFLLIALLFGVALFVVWPLIGTSASQPTLTDASDAAPLSPLTALRAEHDAVLTSLRDLEFDQQTGKLSADDYQAQRAALMARGVETLQQLDALESDVIEAAVAAKRAPRPTLEDRIERSVAARRKRVKAK